MVSSFSSVIRNKLKDVDLANNTCSEAKAASITKQPLGKKTLQVFEAVDHLLALDDKHLDAAILTAEIVPLMAVASLDSVFLRGVPAAQPAS